MPTLQATYCHRRFPPPHPAERGGARTNSMGPGAGVFMSALSDLKAGLSDGQRARQAAQREALKNDLEEQMRQKREAEAARKAALAALEEREGAQLKAYWAGQQQQQQAAAGQAASGDEHAAAPAALAHTAKVRQHQQGSRAAAAPLSARGRGPREQQGGGAADPLGSMAGGARRGEALVQPGITVFLPPDKEAERRGALRARQAAESSSDYAEAVQPQQQQQLQQLASVAASSQGLAAPAWQQLLLAQQQPAASPAQLAALLAPVGANPAALAAGGMGMPLYPYPYPGMLPFLPPPPATVGPALGSSGSDMNPQVLALLRELQQDQRRMQEQFAQQLEAVSRLSGDASAARSERDRARLDLERVQRLLAERQGAGSGSGGGSGAAAYAGRHISGSSDDADLMAVTTHVLPLGARHIPSRLGTPATSARGPPPPGLQRNAAAEAVQAPLPARYRHQAVEPWQQGRKLQQGGAPAAASRLPAASGATSGPRGSQGRARAAAGGAAAGSKGPALPAKGWRK